MSKFYPLVFIGLASLQKITNISVFMLLFINIISTQHKNTKILSLLNLNIQYGKNYILWFSLAIRLYKKITNKSVFMLHFYNIYQNSCPPATARLPLFPLPPLLSQTPTTIRKKAYHYQNQIYINQTQEHLRKIILQNFKVQYAKNYILWFSLPCRYKNC